MQQTNTIYNKFIDSLYSLLNTLKLKEVYIMLCLGFSSGLPILLIFGTLSLWLNEAGTAKSTITFFSWAALGYSFKFIWAPLIDHIRLPVLANYFGHKRSWLLVTQLFIIISILGMALTNPAKVAFAESSYYLVKMAIFAVMLGFSSASQDIVIDAYRIESIDDDKQAIASAAYIFGYRVAMIIASAFAIWISDYMGSSKGYYLYSAWRNTYFIMALFCLIGVITTLIIKEPNSTAEKLDSNGSKELVKLFIVAIIPFIAVFFITNPILSELKKELKDFANAHIYFFLLSFIRMMLAFFVSYLTIKILTKLKLLSYSIAKKAYWLPINEFLVRFPAKTTIFLLLLIGFYRVSDIVLGNVANIFYQDLGFSKTEIAAVVKTFGLIMTLLGSALGGVISLRIGVTKTLFIGAFLSAITNLLFMLLANLGDNIIALYLVISADNLSAGIATVAFVAFLSKLTSVKFTATQYAIFSSIMLLLPKLIGGYSGTIVENYSYESFFLFTTILGLPVIFLTIVIDRLLKAKQ